MLAAHIEDKVQLFNEALQDDVRTILELYGGKYLFHRDDWTKAFDQAYKDNLITKARYEWLCGNLRSAVPQGL
jgi:hypothetical protein